MGESPWGLRSKLTVLSANVRDLHNNIGDLTNNFILKYSADIAVATETWLNDEVEPLEGSEVHPVGQERQAYTSMWRHCCVL